MKLYLCTKIGNVNYDEYDSCVVIAPNKKEAIKLASNLLYDEDWFETKEIILSDYKESEILLSSFNAG